MITLADAIDKEIWETAFSNCIECGDLYTAAVGTGKVRPVMIVGVSRDEVCYLEFTSRSHTYRKQLILEGYGLDRQTHLATDQVYRDSRSILLKKIGHVPESYLLEHGLEQCIHSTPVVKEPYWFKYEYGRRYAS